MKTFSWFVVITTNPPNTKESSYNVFIFIKKSERFLFFQFSFLFNFLTRTKCETQNSQSYEVEQIQAMVVVHNFPSTSWLQATDGTSNVSFSQSPAPAPAALASTWHHNEKDRLGRKAAGGAGQMQFPKYGATCEKEYKMEHNTRAQAVAAHILAKDCVSTLGNHQEGRVKENTERCLNYLERGFRSSRDTSLLTCFFLTNQNKF